METGLPMTTARGQIESPLYPMCSSVGGNGWLGWQQGPHRVVGGRRYWSLLEDTKENGQMRSCHWAADLSLDKSTVFIIQHCDGWAFIGCIFNTGQLYCFKYRKEGCYCAEEAACWRLPASSPPPAPLLSFWGWV